MALKEVRENLPKWLDLAEAPGATRKESGNFEEHNLDKAKREVREFLAVINR